MDKYLPNCRSYGFCTCDRKHPYCPVCSYNEALKDCKQALSKLKMSEEKVAKIITDKCKEINAEWWEKDAMIYAKFICNNWKDLLE